jgi:hypothetical protein
MSKRDHKEFTQLAQAFGLQPFDAAKHVLDEARLGRPVARWLRRAARTLTRRAAGPEGR